MACKAIVSSLALNELEISADWYEERAVGLGGLFIEFIYKAFSAIELTPEAYPQKKNNYREFTVLSFLILLFTIITIARILFIYYIFFIPAAILS